MTSPKGILQSSKICVCGSQNCAIPYGFCHCGCGGKAPISKGTDRRLKSYKGKPRRFIPYHYRSLSKVPRLEDVSTFKIDGDRCRLIALTRGQYAIVDESRFEYLMDSVVGGWHALWDKTVGSFYAVGTIKGKDGKMCRVTMHRLLLGLTRGDGIKSDHKSHNTLDNRIRNLRSATPHQSSCNRRIFANNTSGYKGVSWRKDRKRWIATVVINGKPKRIGSFNTKEDAGEAYRKAAAQFYGEFACLEDDH